MFDICKTINVYNIENHFHYYPQRKHSLNKSNVQSTVNTHNKLKVTPIKIYNDGHDNHDNNDLRVKAYSSL